MLWMNTRWRNKRTFTIIKVLFRKVSALGSHFCNDFRQLFHKTTSYLLKSSEPISSNSHNAGHNITSYLWQKWKLKSYHTGCLLISNELINSWQALLNIQYRTPSPKVTSVFSDSWLVLFRRSGLILLEGCTFPNYSIKTAPSC